MTTTNLYPSAPLKSVGIIEESLEKKMIPTVLIFILPLVKRRLNISKMKTGNKKV